MVQGSPEQAKRLALAYPGFDVVVSTSPFADPLEGELKLNGGKTLLVHVGRRGKYVGAIGFFPDDAETMRFYLVTLEQPVRRPGHGDEEGHRGRVPQHAQVGRDRRELPPPRLRERHLGGDATSAQRPASGATRTRS